MREMLLEQRGTCRIRRRETCLILRLLTFMVIVILSEQEPSVTGDKGTNIGGGLCCGMTKSLANIEENAARGF